MPRYIKPLAGDVMHREFDIFEVLPNGSEIWRLCAHGTENALHVLTQLASKTTNECYAIKVETNEIISRVNISLRQPQNKATGSL